MFCWLDVLGLVLRQRISADELLFLLVVDEVLLEQNVNERDELADTREVTKAATLMTVGIQLDFASFVLQ